MTLRGVDPLDDIVYFVHERVGRIEDAYAGRGRCVLTVCPRWQARRSIGYEVSLRFVGGEALAECRRLGRDLFETIGAAFDEVALRLSRTRSGIRGLVAAEPGGEGEAAGGT